MNSLRAWWNFHLIVLPEWLEALRVRWARWQSVRVEHDKPVRPRRLYIDVSVISRHDAGTGIQRVVRAVATHLLGNPPPGWEVVAVGATRKRPYHVICWPSQAPVDPARVIRGGQGDVFLGLDLALDTVRHHRTQLSGFKRAGGELWFVLYDLLPVHRPEWFPDKMVVRYRNWLSVLAALASGFYCISAPVERELREELARAYALTQGFCTRIVPMGGDLEGSRPTSGVPAGFDSVLDHVAGTPTALIVGTLEPRKGHIDVLAAFERLWQEGREFNLMIVGQPGWKTEELQRRLRDHYQAGKRLFWLQGLSDEALSQLYGACYGVIAASFAEGFGLPLVEALGHGKPVLARSLPVYELHRNFALDYFAVDAGVPDLARAIEKWFRKNAGGVVVQGATGAPVNKWSDTAEAIVNSLGEVKK